MLHIRDEEQGGTARVVGEFICREVKVYPTNFLDLYDMANTKAICELIDRARLSYNELCRYANGGRLFGLRISDVRFYEKPKPLSRFSKVGFDHDVPFKYPPMSWAYVYEMQNAECRIEGAKDNDNENQTFILSARIPKA